LGRSRNLRSRLRLRPPLSSRNADYLFGGSGVKLKQMRRLTSFVAVLLMLVTASPMMACVSALSMTPAEKACCAAMQGHCEQMPGHSCCQAHVRNDFSQSPAQQSDLSQIHFPVAAIVPDVAPLLSDKAVFSASDTDRPPPLLRHIATTVLRI